MLEGLSHQLNLGHAFFLENSFDLVYSTRPAHVKHARGLAVEMVNMVHATPNPTADMATSCSSGTAVFLVADKIQLDQGMGGWTTVTG